MKNIYIDRVTGKVTLSPSPLTFIVNVEDNFNPSKIIEAQEGEKQKTDQQGKLLYKMNIGENGTYSETTDSRIVTKYDDKEVENKWTNEDGKEHSETVTVQEPIEWIDNEPVMIPNIISKTITFAEDPTQFTVKEILKAKYQTLLENSSYDYILADIFLNEEDIDVTDKEHAANTGVAIMQLLPKGQAKTKSITLDNSASSFELLELEAAGVDIYINDVKFINNKAILSAATNEVVIKFINTTDKAVDVKSYAIAY